jgi:hypothetical protein
MMGIGAARNQAEGIRWLRKAADQGDVRAQMQLGSSYARGDGIDKDLSQAEKWLRRAADQGDVTSHFQLATIYYAQRRFGEAAHAVRYAADRDMPEAQVFLATLYRQGQGVSVSPQESTRWLRRAANQGNADAQNNFGMSLLRGDGIDRDPSESAVWFERAALQGQVNAQFSLAVQYLKGEGVERDLVRGYAWLEIAAARGFNPALRARGSVRDKLSAQDLSAANELAKELAAELPR